MRGHNGFDRSGVLGVLMSSGSPGKKLVGLGGLEPPTSRLSGGRSNQAELQAPKLFLSEST